LIVNKARGVGDRVRKRCRKREKPERL